MRWRRASSRSPAPHGGALTPRTPPQPCRAAINSKVPKLIVDNVGGPWVVLPLSLVSDQEIEFEKGVEVLAKRGAYLDTNASLLTGSLVNNVVLSGYGATLRMWRDDYDKEPLQACRVAACHQPP